MRKKGFVCLALVSLIFLSLISGCASFGILRVQTEFDTEMFLKDIEENYNKYIIHANEWPGVEVSAIVFDPKDDNKTTIRGIACHMPVAGQCAGHFFRLRPCPAFVVAERDKGI